MTDNRARIVERVVRSLEETRDPETLVWSHFDADRDAFVEATRQTLEATREDASEARIEEALERELVEALRYPSGRRHGLLPHLWVHRGLVAAGAFGVVAVSLLLVLL